MLDWPDFGAALWRVSDATGIRPEWQLPVLYLESGFDPSIVNSIGCSGLNQFCPGSYAQYVSVPVDQYRAWPASQQLAGPVLAYWRDALRYGPIRSAARLMLAQLGPALLGTAPALGSVVYAAPSAAYAGNSGFDTAGKGYFTVQDLADAMGRASRAPAVQQALASAYAMRPGERPTDPVYGEDWSAPGRLSVPNRPARLAAPLFTAAVAVALVAAAGYAALERRRFA
jgi:hypothetical protein